jgi:uncharacterized protein YutE (UPF0331/DUF86 family)
MKKYVDFLKSHKDSSVSMLRSNYMLRSAIERNFQLAIESALDVGEMIISLENFKRPEDYRGVIEILGEEGIIPKDFAKRFASTADFRNILVHMYAEVDLNELYNRLQELDDFDAYAIAICKYLKRKEASIT